MTETHQTDLRLGAFVKEYRGGGAAKLIILLVPITILAALFFGGAVSEAASQAYGGMVALSLIGLVFVAIGVFAVYTLLRGRGSHLRLYENGLTFYGAGKESSTTWDEIDSYTQETAGRIVKRDGGVIEFGLSLKNSDGVAQKIQDETLKLMLPRVKDTIESGGSLQFLGLKPKILANYAKAFSGFTVDGKGITNDDSGTRIAWANVTEAGITQESMGRGTVNVFYIADANQSFRTRLGLLSNFHVLLALCGEMVDRSGQAPAAPRS
jgi:hypothetical protein